MKTEAQVRGLRQVFEERARYHAERRDWDAWMASCVKVRMLDVVLEEEGKPGYVEPIERIPFSAEFARRYAEMLAEEKAGVRADETGRTS